MVVATVLHIWANPRPVHESYSLRLAQEFLENYRHLSPKDEIIDIDLYQQDIPFLDADILQCWQQVQGGCSIEEFSGESRAKLAAVNKLVDGFVAADKYIFVTPLWNLSVPPMMKAYIDSICIAGKTFKYTAQGPVGLLRGKRAVHIQARGGVYSHGPAQEFELGDKYIRTILTFMGVNDIESVIAEGMAHTPEQADQILQHALVRAREAAERFALPPQIHQADPVQHSVHPIH